MLHEMPLIATIVGGLGLAFVFGAIANRFRIPPIVGYLFAGIAVGPFTPGFIADQGLASQLAELGVILLMFGVGLHFSLEDLLSVRAIALPGAVVQIVIATSMGFGLGQLTGWTVGAGLVFGIALSVASTVVLLRAVQERHLMETERGRIAVGWLIVEDLAMVLVLVLLPALASVLGASRDALVSDPLAAHFGFGLPGVLLLTFVKVAIFVGLMLIVGRRVIPWILHYIAHTGSRELFRLSVLAIALCVAFGAAKLFGVSLALGAFFAGMVLSESPLSQRAAQESLPLRDAFAVLFFVSVGMLFDPATVWREPWLLAATIFIIIVGKSLAALVIVLAFRYSLATALTISASLAQIGEFSFILAELGVTLNLLPKEGRDLILAGAIISILLNPLIFATVDWLTRRFNQEARHTEPATASEDFAPKSTALTNYRDSPCGSYRSSDRALAPTNTGNGRRDAAGHQFGTRRKPHRLRT
jgi:CPA2 family monovalent cation:H+ antiporter-2